MDRYEWLKCQSWLLPCAVGSPIDVDWCFEGLASFYTSSQQQVETLSENAAHLFFSAEAPSLDPAQLALKLGVAQSVTPMLGSDVVLLFDDGNFYHLDFKQVLAIMNWEQEQGCKVCEKSSPLPADARRGNASCACQFLPPYVLVQLKHVSMIIFPRDSSRETGLGKILSATDVLCKTFEVRKISNGQLAAQKDSRKIGSALSDPENADYLRDIYSSKQTMQQFWSKLEFVSRCALAAAECCNADVPGMSRLLNVMMHHVAVEKEQSLQLKPLQCHLQSCLVSLENEEQRHISSIWAASSTQQQEAKAGAMVALQCTAEKRIQTEEALLWLDLVNYSTIMD